ncbi:BlaI/MecI/CopY family transcriptional regulator [Lederbergia wuyishanensis]|uniref:BlaI family penicillinase repressor n=1 Tax=Lederbergia wuyishanensis TaxID=1347903 RepID=A0ABU0DAN0_9BACI|nr:BlaI/MecI/CopY family transcriptional regulator [Lederbergia wuyishanensis]MCJ8009654.1 BlaI/MecI/CopY family transcriptional regulator [Lederbergia wuyishanensis]MDQ0345472.1 BlaI family penicillinase repressor [Lederbergia wuyishanensis]
MKEEAANITEAEWVVMQVLWNSDSLPMSEIIHELTQSTDWKPKTIQTLVTRLVSKKVVGYEQEGRKRRYFALVSEEESIQNESESFLQRIFGGALQPMLVHLVKTNKLSQDDVEELKRLLDERRD